MPVDQFLFAVLIPRAGFLQTILRLLLIVQISALLFRTTSPLEIREVVRLEIISLFICFIPEIFKTWTSINLAWKSRGGRQGLPKIKTLIFVLITLSFEKAAIKAKALQARS
jgi:biotin transport system permease protein/energy-coupling factor transport system permease protein